MERDSYKLQLIEEFIKQNKSFCSHSVTIKNEILNILRDPDKYIKKKMLDKLQKEAKEY